MEQKMAQRILVIPRSGPSLDGRHQSTKQAVRLSHQYSRIVPFRDASICEYSNPVKLGAGSRNMPQTMCHCYDCPVGEFGVDQLVDGIFRMLIQTAQRRHVVSYLCGLCEQGLGGTYELVASSSNNIRLLRSMTLARQKSCFWPLLNQSASKSTSRPPFSLMISSSPTFFNTCSKGSSSDL